VVNLGVSDVHTYRTSILGVLVHNGPCPKAESPVWQALEPHKGRVKTNGATGGKKEFYTWDHTHNEIEVFNRRGVHKGAMDPQTGSMYKPAVPGREIKREI